jgi:hypothetical protein
MLLLVTAALVCALPVQGQEEGQETGAAEGWVYSTYFVCDITRQEEVDEVVDSVLAPLWDAAVAGGEITAWGWLKHHTGGPWRRALYTVGNDRDALMATLDRLNGTTGEDEAAAPFGEVCNSHSDYLWKMGASSEQSAAEAPGTAGLSVYLECDMTEEAFVDVLVETFFAPVFDAHVAEGELTSWSWLQHEVGGEYRRLLAMRAESNASLLGAWDAILAEIETSHGGALSHFTGICGSHADYIWATHR